MRHFFFRFLAFLSLFTLIAGCARTPTAHLPTLDGPHQADADLQRSTALVVDFAPSAPPYCTGVWVARDTFMTANHCVEAYPQMHHTHLVTLALIQMGMPPEFAAMFGHFRPQDIPANAVDSPIGQLVIQANALFPMEDPATVTLSYVVPGDATELGVRPTVIHHAQAVALYPKEDIAVVRTSGWVPDHAVAQLADQPPYVGETVSLVGNTGGTWFNYRQTQVSAYRGSLKAVGADDQPFMEVSPYVIDSGDSGSGVFNDRGQLVGLADMTNRRTHYGFCLRLETLRAVMIGQHLMKAKLDLKAADPPVSR